MNEEDGTTGLIPNADVKSGDVCIRSKYMTEAEGKQRELRKSYEY